MDLEDLVPLRTLESAFGTVLGFRAWDLWKAIGPPQEFSEWVMVTVNELGLLEDEDIIVPPDRKGEALSLCLTPLAALDVACNSRFEGRKGLRRRLAKALGSPAGLAARIAAIEEARLREGPPIRRMGRPRAVPDESAPQLWRKVRLEANAAEENPEKAPKGLEGRVLRLLRLTGAREPAEYRFMRALHGLVAKRLGNPFVFGEVRRRLSGHPRAAADAAMRRMEASGGLVRETRPNRSGKPTDYWTLRGDPMSPPPAGWYAACLEAAEDKLEIKSADDCSGMYVGGMSGEFIGSEQPDYYALFPGAPRPL
ncbi:MAG: hypothetical protein LBW85_09605 [Deltaproteobacteria bacterium]|nr:hypothetical protein [Deltaproteobacteria bacterium]